MLADLKTTFELKIGEESYLFTGRAVKSFELNMESYGWGGRLTIEQAEDKTSAKLFKAFSSDEIIFVTAKIQTVNTTQGRGKPEIIEVQGVTTQRSFSEVEFVQEN